MRSVHALGVAALVMLALQDSSFAEPKSGGILRMYHRDRAHSPMIKAFLETVRQMKSGKGDAAAREQERSPR